MQKRTDSTTKKQIVTYWQNQSTIDHSIDEIYLNFDWSDADTHCWNCGEEHKHSLERCHIVPQSKNGLDIPSNYVLLCKECHIESPDSTNPNRMWDWIKMNKLPMGVPSYKLLKLLILFENRHSSKKFNDFFQGFDSNFVIEELEKLLQETAGVHGFNFSIETYYSVLCDLIDKLDTLRYKLSK